MITEKYELENGQGLFMSRKTRTRLQDDIFANSGAAPTLASLEYPMNFQMFVSIFATLMVFSVGLPAGLIMGCCAGLLVGKSKSDCITWGILALQAE